MDNRILSILNFIKEIDKLKSIQRISYLSDGDTREDDTQHSWHMAMMILLLKDELDIEFDLLKALKLALVHDLGEIYVGDEFVGHDEEKKLQKDKREQESLEKVLSILPEDLQDEIFGLYEEYKEKKTIEAKLVKSIDIIQYQIQYLVAGHKYYGEGSFEWTKEDEVSYGKKLLEFNGVIKKIYDMLIDERDW